MAGKQADIKVGVITNYDDKGLKQAEGGLKGFKSSIAQAEGAGGKLKAGWGSVTDSIKANAGGLAVGAGAALVAFGVKAVAAFTDTAKAAIDMGAATGLSTENASRWIAVADDMGVSAEALQAGIGKIGKTLDGAQWEKYGIATRDAGGQARDVNDILLDSFDKLGKITNETERAKAGNELFGKGYASLAPLIGKTREEMQTYLGAVEKGQVITDKEAKKAEKFRLAQDALNDALKDVQLSVGEVVAGLAPMIEQTAETVTKLSDLAEKADTATESVGGLANVVMAAGNPLAAFNVVTSALTDVVDEESMSLEELNAMFKEAGASQEYITMATARWYEANKLLNPSLVDTDRETRRLTSAMGSSEQATEDLAEATDEAKRKSDAYSKALQGQLDKLDELYPKEYNAVTAKYDYADAQAAAMIAVDALNTTLGNNKAKQEEVDTATRNARDAIIQQSEEFATLDGAALGSQGAIARQIKSLEAQRDTLAPGSPLRLFLDQYISDLNNIPSNIDTFMNLHVSKSAVNPGAPGYLPVGGGIQRGAEGGIVKAKPGGQLVLAAEAGSDEALVPLDGKHGLGGNTVNITVNAGLGTNGYDVAKVIVNNLAEYDRRNGTHIVTPAGR